MEEVDGYSGEAEAKKEQRKAELLPKISAHNLRHIACANMVKCGMKRLRDSNATGAKNGVNRLKG